MTVACADVRGGDLRLRAALGGGGELFDGVLDRATAHQDLDGRGGADRRDLRGDVVEVVELPAGCRPPRPRTPPA